jgi:hypothetical protein
MSCPRFEHEQSYRTHHSHERPVDRDGRCLGRLDGEGRQGRNSDLLSRRRKPERIDDEIAWPERIGDEIAKPERIDDEIGS